MFSNIEFFISEAWSGFRRSGLMSIISIVIITISLIIFGIFLLAILNMNNFVDTIGSKLEIVAYVNKNLDEWSVNKLQVEIKRIPGVDKVAFLPKDKAWAQFKGSFQKKLDIADIIKWNPLPNAFIVTVEKPEFSDKVAKQVSSFSVIDEVRYSGAIAAKVRVLANAMRIGGFIVVILLGFATLLIVVNTIRLTVLARQTDITIMRLVGATDNFIKWPFIIEGVIIGMIGSVLSFIILKFSYDAIALKVNETLPFLPVVLEQGRLLILYTIVTVVGISLGMLGGYISVSRSLKDRI